MTIVQHAQITPYLYFAGRCDEAFAFYSKTLGAKVEFAMRFNESPEPIPEGILQPGFESKVMHATLRIGSSTVMASDGTCDSETFSGFRLSIVLDDAATAHLAFDALAVGGKVEMPLCKTFWSPCFGMVTDQFNVGWMISVQAAAT